MKRYVVVASMAPIFMIGATANAQNSLTLYGRLDNGIEYMSGLPNQAGTGSTSRWRAESGNFGTSMWGLKGTEDLGGGLSAIFQLESGFNSSNGQFGTTGTLFDRFADVGLTSETYGTFLLGRQLQIANDVWDFDPFGQTNWSSASLVRGRNWNYSSNNASYQSPKWNGFDIHAQYSFSNATNFNGNGTTAQGRGAGAAITYTNPLFQVRGMYDEIRDPGNGGLDDAFNFSREYFAGVNVFLGQVKLSAVYQASRTASAQGSSTVSSTDQEWAGLTYQVTPAASLIAAAYHMNANRGGGNATLYSIGGAYNISKRTLLDFQVATVRNSKTGTYGLEAQPVVNSDNPLAGHSQSGAYLGIEHSF